MNEEIKKLIKDTDAVHMTEDEKKRMKSAVFAYVDANPLPKQVDVARPIPSPFSHFVKWHFTGGVAASLGFAALFVFAGVTSGVAENALPGDALYSYKINVNEQVVKSLSFGNEAKARAFASIAERRLVELEQLTIEEKTEKRPRDEKVIAALNENFRESAEEVHNYVAKIEEEGNIGDAMNVTVTFETTLSAHSDILEEVNEDTEAASESLGTTTATTTTAGIGSDMTATSTGTTTATLATTSAPQAVRTPGIVSTSTSVRATSTAATSTPEFSSILSEVKTQEGKADSAGNKLDGLLASSTATSTLEIVSDSIESVAKDRLEELEDEIDDIVDAELEEEFADEIQKFEDAKEAHKEAGEIKGENIKASIRLNKEASRAAHEAIVLIKTQQELDINLENK